MPDLAAIVVIAKLIGAQRPQIGQMFPDRLFQLGGLFPADATVHLKKFHRTSAITPEGKANPGRLAILMVHQVSKVGMRNGGTQHQMNIQMAVG